MLTMTPKHRDVCHHQLRGIRAPYLLVLQHHVVGGPTRICAPVVPRAKGAGTLEPNVLLPTVEINGVPHHAVLLNMAAVPLTMLGNVVGSGLDEDIGRGLEAIFSGMPAWLPH